MGKGDKGFHLFLKICTLFALSGLLFILGYILKEATVVFREISLFSFLTGKTWDPVGGKNFEILPTIAGSLYISFLGLLFSFPLGVGTSLWLSYEVSGKKKYYLSSFIDIVAGIPSVIVGFIGLLVVVKAIENLTDLSSGETVLAGGIVLAFMMLPYEISMITESLDKVKEKYRGDLMSLGIDRYYGATRLVLPASKDALLAAGVTALARGLGETMAVMMVIGNSNLMPCLFGKAETIPGRIALEMGMATVGSLHYHALFASALVLILMVLVLNGLNLMLQSRFERRIHGEGK